MPDAVDDLLSRVRERLTPDADERGALADAVATVTERAEAAVADLRVDADVLHLGSTARNTWLAGGRDIDIFVRFPATLDREELETYGLQVGHAVLPDGREAFADHPYVVGTVDRFEVDLVPCYAVEDAADIRSAVDRTPFHNDYLAARFDDDLAGEVRVAKQFLTAIDVYGSDLRTRGFSGFLVELLILEYGTARGFFEAAAGWQPPVRLDPADHGTVAFDDPLVVVDPTDPERNVAAVCTERNVARLQHHARRLLADPEPSRFEQRAVEPLNVGALEAVLDRRGTTPVAVRTTTPDLVDDQLYPQLEKSRTGIVGGLEAGGFDVVRSAAWADETAVVYADLAVAERPRIERHEGPPVHVREHAETFYDTYAVEEAVYGPFVDGDRYVVERPRDVRTARAYLDSTAIFDVGLGAAIEDALEAGYDVLIGGEVTALVDEFGADLAAFYDPKP